MPVQLSDSLVGAIIGALISGSASFLILWRDHKFEKKNKERFSASVLLNDLKSIERYMTEEDNSTFINVRYSDIWQHSVSDCCFLTDSEIEWIYKFYDEVYNFNYIFSVVQTTEGRALRVNRQFIIPFSTMKKMMFGETKSEYESLKAHLQKKAK